jgi:hypothetical protein
MAAADAAEECTICFETPQPGAEVCTLRCGHGYCHADIPRVARMLRGAPSSRQFAYKLYNFHFYY